MDNSSSREHLLRNATSEVQKLQQDLDAAIRAKDLAYQENRRIQDDLAACTADCRNAHNDLDIARRQIDDLKRQLQQYVAEVKRTEDLISHKEIERNEMLDHFRSLSQEATVLESNNHSLETEASQTKVQLSLALDHASDLERKLEARDTMIRSYEKQIADLTAQIARMEIQVSQHAKFQEQSEAEMVNMRELCVKLDKQKDDLMRQLNEVDGARAQVGREADRLRRESESLQNTLAKDRNSQENIEKLLAQCRQECVDQKLLNQELQVELQRCKSKVEELQIKLLDMPQKVRDDAFQSLQSESHKRDDNNFIGATKSDGHGIRPFENDHITDQGRTSNRRLSFSLPDNSSVLRKNVPVMSPIPEYESESLVGTQHLQSIRDGSSFKTRPSNNIYSIRSIERKEEPRVKANPESEYETIAHGQRLQTLRDSSGLKTRLNNIESIRNASVVDGKDGGITANTQHSRSIRDASGNIIGSIHRNASFTAESRPSPIGSRTIRDSSGIKASLDQSNHLNQIVDLRSQGGSSITRTRSPSSSIRNASVDSFASANEVSSRRHPSFSERSANADFTTSHHTESLTEKLSSALRHLEPSAGKSVSETELAKNLPYKSISAYQQSVHEQDYPNSDMPSLLPYVSPSHRLSISSESGRPTRDQEQDDNFRDKSQRDKPCACLRVCKCHEEIEGGRSYRPYSPYGAPVSFGVTCVFTSTGPPTSHYTASYAFAYENLNTTQALRTKMSSKEFNKQS